MSQREEADKFLAQMESFANAMKESVGVPVLVDQKTGSLLWYSQRELRLRYMISVERLRRFFEALPEGKILATRCRVTGRVFFPPQRDCPDHPGEELEWVELPSDGELLTFTKITVKPYSFSHYDDYIVGIARLENGVNVLAWVRERDPGKLRIGMKVRLEVVKREPEGYFTYEIVPVEQDA